MNNIELKNLINTFLKKNKLEKGLLNIEVKKAWFDLMNNGVANYTSDVSSPALKEELSYGKEKLIKLINEKLEEDVVEKIVLN